MSNVHGVEIQNNSKKVLTTEIEKYLNTKKFARIYSLNPEILVQSHENSHFKEVLNKAEIKLIDGVGVVMAAKILGISIGERTTGVDLMQDLIKLAEKMKLRVLIIGGFDSVSSELATKLQVTYNHAVFKGVKGYENINNPSSLEEKKVQEILKEFKPNLVFVAFGAPAQEFWIDDHKQFLQSSVCMAVGGAVDFLVGNVQRAPLWIRKIGLEWLYRLIQEPWRWKRQLKLLTFLRLVLQQRLARL